MYLPQDSTIQKYVDLGVPRHKLVLGVAAYGRSFTISTVSHVGDTSGGPGAMGTYTGAAGFLAFYEVNSSFV